MNNSFLDYFMIAILGFCVLMFVTGNGEKLLMMFGGDRSTAMQEYDREKMIRASMILCIVLLLDELALFFFGTKIPWLAIATVIISVAALITYVVYLKKCAKK